jgi:alkyl hydroperoxide reductase subunit D
MTIDGLKDLLKDYAKDIRLNVGAVLSEGALTETQRLGVFLASAYSTKHPDLIAMATEIAAPAGEKTVEAAKIAATIMAMNNVYYRFLHLNEDEAFGKLPARLRMNGMANPGVEKADFELMSLAVSAINGCGMCMRSHREVLQKHEVSNEAIQHAVRIAAVAQATAQALVIN